MEPKEHSRSLVPVVHEQPAHAQRSQVQRSCQAPGSLEVGLGIGHHSSSPRLQVQSQKKEPSIPHRPQELDKEKLMAKEQRQQQQEAPSMEATPQDKSWSSCSCSRPRSCHLLSPLFHSFSLHQSKSQTHHDQATLEVASCWAQHSWFHFPQASCLYLSRKHPFRGAKDPKERN